MSHHLLCPLPYHCRDLSHPAAWCSSQVFVELNQYTWLSLDNYDPLIINSPLPPSSFALRKCPQTRSIPSLQQLGRTSTLRLHILSLPLKETRSKNNAWHHHPHTSQQRRHVALLPAVVSGVSPHSAPSLLVEPSFAGGWTSAAACSGLFFNDWRFVIVQIHISEERYSRRRLE